MSDTLNIKDIGSLLELLDKHEVSEFKLERENEKIWLKRKGAETPAEVQQQPAHSSPIHQVFTSLPQQGGSQPVYDNGGVPAAPTAVPQAVAPAATPAEQAATPVTNAKDVVSPMVGTFYRRPAVDADPYVSVGDKVKKGDVLCIVEAMKLMNEIECEFAGTIVDICLEDGQMVEFGEPLFRIDPL